MENEMLIQMENLTKRFSGVTALRGIDWNVPAGRIVGVLGPNGSGKSTLLRHVVGWYLPSEGSCRTLGKPAKDLDDAELEQIGYVDQEGELIDWMLGRQFLKYLRAYYPRWNDALEARLVERLQVRLDQRIGVMSPGDRQKLAVVAAVCFEPRLLILDEPASGLDPIARAELMKILLELIQDSKRTILISSHILSDIEKVVDHIVMIRRGEIRRDCSLDALREDYCQMRVAALNGALPSTWPFSVLEETRNQGSALLKVRGQSPETLLRHVQQARCTAEISPLSLEEIYRLEMKETV